MSNTITTTTRTPSRLKQFLSNRLALLCIIGGLLLIILPITGKAWRLVKIGRSLQAHQLEAEALLQAGPTNMNPDHAAALVNGVHRDVMALKAEVSPLLPLTPYLTWVPKVGPLMPAAPQLLDMATIGTQMGVQLMNGLKPALIVMQDDTLGEARIPVLIQVLDDARPELVQAAASFDKLVAVRQTIGDTEEFPATVQQMLALMDEQTPLVQDGFQVAQVLPLIMGQTGPKQYLIVAQNEDELRPTGGFISGVGVLTVEQGRLVNLNFVDAYQVDDLKNLGNYGWPPQPLNEFMASDYFLFRDGNFWPNFPTSAQTMMALYKRGQGVAVDGVIAIDQRFLELLVAALEPVPIPELELTLNSQNVRQNLQAAWETGSDDEIWLKSRKSFMGPMANGILQKIMQDPGGINPVKFARALQESLDGRHLQIYMVDPQVAETLAAVGWNGRLQPLPYQDNLLIVDSNLGFNKVNAIVEKQVTYEVQLAADAPSTATLTMLYKNPSTGTADCTEIVANYNVESGIPYSQLINACYRNYVRVYTPPGSQLLAASEHPVTAENLLRKQAWSGHAETISEATEWATFANYFLLPRQQETTVSFEYNLPPTAIQNRNTGELTYKLHIYKQAGAKPHPLTIAVQLPPDAVLVQATPLPTAVNGQTVMFKTTLDRDLSFTLTFR